MTMNRTVGQKEEISGFVRGRFHPGWRIAKSTGKPYLASGKLVLDTDDGECEVSFLQVYVDGERSDTLMPQLWNDIDEDIKGKEVAITCTFEKDYTNPTTGAVKHQFRSPTSIKYLNPGDAPPPVSAQTTQVAQTGVAPPTVTPTTAPMATPTPQSVSPFSLDERIAWNSAINNMFPLGENTHPIVPFNMERYRGYADDDGKRIEGEGSAYLDEFFSEVGRVAYSLYKVIRRGPVQPVEPVQITPEEELPPEPTDLGDGVIGLNRTGEI